MKDLHDQPWHLPVLDGVRGLAIILVLARHLTMSMYAATGVDDTFQSICAVGWIGVDLFFVLSGFLITGILYDAKGTKHYFRNFYARRALRIFPLYYAFFAVLLFVAPLLARLSPVVRSEVSLLRQHQEWYWLYLTNMLPAFGGAPPLNTGHFWSLAVEEQFYLLWPVLVFLSNRRLLLRLCLGIAVGSLLFRIAMLAVPNGGTIAYMWMPARLDGLALGGVLALLVRSPSGMRWLGRLAPRVLVVTGAGLISYFALRGEFTAFEPVVWTLGFSVLALFFTALLACAVTASPETPLRRALSASWLRAFGRFSYALYVIHYPILYFLGPDHFRSFVPTIGGSELPAQLVFIVTATGIFLIMAWASWHLFEKRFLALKRFFPSGSLVACPPPQAAPGSFQPWKPRPGHTSQAG